MPTQHSTLTGADLHETKGAATATSGQFLTANGNGTATFKTLPVATVGWYDYNDLATQTTAIPLTAGVKADLTNDTLGVNTQTGFGFDGVNLWNPGTNRFNFTGLTIGDIMSTRFDLTVITTNANTAVLMEVEFATGTGSAFTLAVIQQTNFKVAGTYQLTRDIGWYIGSALVRDNPARVRFLSDTAGASVRVNGWFSRVFKGAA